MACATMRAFAKVKSSAITPRQPSVPNLIEDMCAGKSIREAINSKNSRIGLLEKFLPALRFEPFHDFSYILGAVARADKQRIWCLNHHQITDADRGNEFGRAPEKIAFRIKRVALSGKDILAAFLCQQFINGCPGANIAPAHFCRNHKNARRSLDASGGVGERGGHRKNFLVLVKRRENSRRGSGSP